MGKKEAKKKAKEASAAPLELPLQLPVTTTGTSGLLLWTPMLAVTTAPPASTTAFADTS